MRVQRIQLGTSTDISYILLDEHDQPIPVVSDFMRHLRARGYSPNTLSAYAYDLLHFMTFLQERRLTYLEFSPPHAIDFLQYLSMIPSRKRAQRLSIVLSTKADDGSSATRLSPATMNRIMATVSSFYEYLILSGKFSERENPIQQVDNPALARVSERHRPFMGRVSRQRPVRRATRVKTVLTMRVAWQTSPSRVLLPSLRLYTSRGYQRRSQYPQSLYSLTGEWGPVNVP
jgi:hypothetical protein